MPKITISHSDSSKICSQKDFLLAVRTLNSKVVEYLYYTDAHLEAEEKGWTPLALAIHEGSLPLVQFLIQLGANPEAVNKSGYTPLMQAIARGHLSIIRFLIETKKVAVEITKEAFRASLLHAMNCRRFHVVAYFKAYDSSMVNLESGPGLFAISNGWLDAFEIFLQQITYSDAMHLLGEAYRAATFREKYDSSTQTVLAHLNQLINLTNTVVGETKLTFLLAVRNGDLQTVRRLITHETINPQVLGPCVLYWALAKAVKSKYFELYNYLKENGFSLHATDEAGNTILHFAVETEDLATVQYLQNASEEKIDVNALNKYNETPLLRAIKKKCHLSVVQSLFSTQDLSNPRLRYALCFTITEIADFVFSSAGQSNPLKDLTPLAGMIKNEWFDVLEIYIQSHSAFAQAMEEAICWGSLLVVQHLLKLNSSLSCDFRWESVLNTLLKHAEEKKQQFEIIQFLFEQEIPFTEKDLEPLVYWAAVLGAKGNPRIFDYLLKQGIHINLRNGGLLYLATKDKSLETVKFLVNRGADITLAYSKDWTPLVLATWLGHAHIVEFLFRQLIDAMNTGNVKTETVYEIIRESFFTALEQKHWDIISFFLINEIEIDLTCLKRTFLGAVEEKEQKCLKQLISYGVKTKSSYFHLNSLIRLKLSLELIAHRVEHCAIDLEAKDGLEGTALCVAAARGQRSIIDYLLARGAKPSACDENGNNLLHFAIIQGWTDLAVKLIQEMNMNPSFPNKEGCTPAILAAMYNRRDILEFLISQKVDLEAYTPFYGTAVGAAARFGHLSIIEFLKGCKVKLDVANRFGHFPCHLAVGYLVSRKESDSTSCLAVIQYFLDNGFDINTTDLQGNTLLHLVANNNNAHNHRAREIIKFLLSKGADPTLRNKNGHTAYQHAECRGFDYDEIFPAIDEEVPNAIQYSTFTKTIGGKLTCYITSVKPPPIHSDVLPLIQDQKVADAGDPPLGQKYSRKWTGMNYSVIKTQTKSFMLLPSCDALGTGITGKVKMALDLTTHKMVAVKIITPDDNPQIDDNIQREINVLKKMGRFVDCCSLQKTHGLKKVYIFQELFDGTSLNKPIKDKYFAYRPVEGFRAMLSYGTELFRLHQQNLAHVDVAPRNVLFNSLTKESHAVDFGVTAPMGSNRIIIASDYHPPEAGNRSYFSMSALKPSYDVFLLGQMLKETFALDSKGLEEEHPEIQEDVRRLVKLMMHDDPEKRPSLVQCLHELLKLYEQTEEPHESPIQMTIPDFRMSSSFLLFRDLLKNLPDENIKRCKEESDFPGIKFETFCRESESKSSTSPTLFFQPTPSESERQGFKMVIYLKFDGSFQLFKSTMQGLIEVTDHTLNITTEGKLEIIPKTKPDIAADLFASLKHVPTESALPRVTS